MDRALYNSKIIDLSVCIVTWNLKNLLIECIESIYQYTTDINYEIIVVDNGSEDGTAVDVRKKFPGLHIIIYETNQGFTFANNQAMRRANGRYVILLNNDTLLQENALAKMVDYMDRFDNIGALGCKLRSLDGRIEPSANYDVKWHDGLNSLFGMHRLLPNNRYFGRPRMNHIDYENIICDVGWLTGAALMVRREAYEQVGLLDETIFAFSEDWEWCVRIRNGGWRVVYFSQTEIIHYGGASSHANNKNSSISEWAIMTAATSGFYTFRKLNSDNPITILLYDFSRRIFFLSRAIAYIVNYILKPQPFYLGRAKGYGKAAVTSYNVLKTRHLRTDENKKY